MNGDVGQTGMLGRRGCWADGDVGQTGMLGRRTGMLG